MARFSIKKREKPSNGWKETQLKNAYEITGENFDPSVATPEQFIEELKNHHLDEIKKTFYGHQNANTQTGS